MTAAKAPRRSWFWLQGAVAGGVAAIMPGWAVIAGVLLCPAIAFYAAEQMEHRPVGRAMLLCGSTALFKPLHTLWDHDGTLSASLDILADPTCPLLAWIACGSGWLLCEGAQVTARLAAQSKIRRQTQALIKEQSDLTAEWTEAGAA